VQSVLVLELQALHNLKQVYGTAASSRRGTGCLQGSNAGWLNMAPVGPSQTRSS
jgi:hypothetical protein